MRSHAGDAAAAAAVIVFDFHSWLLSIAANKWLAECRGTTLGSTERQKRRRQDKGTAFGFERQQQSYLT